MSQSMRISIAVRPLLLGLLGGVLFAATGMPAAGWQEDLPSSPAPIETIEEDSDATPPTTPVVDPSVLSPTVNTPLNTTPIGGSGLGGGAFGQESGLYTGVFGSRHLDPDGQASRIVYLIDASGSMMRAMPFVYRELQRSIEALDEEQQYRVVFFNGSGIGEMPGGDEETGWQAATGDNKAAAGAWLMSHGERFHPHGPASRHLLEVLAQVLAGEPSAVFFISDAPTGKGRHEVEQQAVLDTIESANNGESPTPIHGIQMLSHDPLMQIRMRPTLQRIAEETGANYRFVDRRELNLR